MSKKIVIPVIAALVLTLMAGLAVSSTALAQGAGPLGRLLKARPVLGQVTAIGKSRFYGRDEGRDGTDFHRWMRTPAIAARTKPSWLSPT